METTVLMHFLRLWDRFKVEWTPFISEYIIEPIQDDEYFKEALGKVNNVKNGQKQPKTAKMAITKEMAVLMHFIKRTLKTAKMDKKR